MKISVIVPCFNGGRYLSQALTSIANQTIPPHETILIDDGSTDMSMAMAEEFPTVRIVRNSKDRGIGYTRQKGLDEADGSHVAFLSADDVWDIGFLEYSMMALDCYGQATYSNYYSVGPNMERLGLFEAPEWSRKEVIAWALRKNMFVNFSTVVFPTDVDARFEPGLRHGEDIAFLLDTLAIDLDWVGIRDPLVCYRVHPAMGSKTQTRKEFDLTWRHIQYRLLDLGVSNDDILAGYKRTSHRTYGLIPRIKKGLRKILK